MRNRGFGTNFHKTYGSSAKLYHSFSAAEYFSPALIKRIKNAFVHGVLLDVACGTCQKTNFFSSFFEKVYALDYSAVLLNFAKIKYGNNKKFNFIWSSASRIPLLDQSVDTILVTWGSFPLSRTLREMKRVLKKGGIILRIGACVEDEFTTLFPSFDMKRIDRINKTFISHGFTIERHEVTIRFKTTKEAKAILGEIVGAPKKKIKKMTYTHKVAFCFYQNI